VKTHILQYGKVSVSYVEKGGSVYSHILRHDSVSESAMLKVRKGRLTS
jgi:hypothetical protein